MLTNAPLRLTKRPHTSTKGPPGLEAFGACCSLVSCSARPAEGWKMDHQSKRDPDLAEVLFKGVEHPLRNV